MILPSMLILVRPSSTLMWTTSPIAAAAADRRVEPGRRLEHHAEDDAVLPLLRRSLPRQRAGDERGEQRERAGQEARIERCEAMAWLRRKTEPPLYGIARWAFSRAPALDVLARRLARRRSRRHVAAAVGRATSARAAASPAPRGEDARRRSPRRAPRRCTGAAGRSASAIEANQALRASASRPVSALAIAKRGPVLDPAAREAVVVQRQRVQRQLARRLGLRRLLLQTQVGEVADDLGVERVGAERLALQPHGIGGRRRRCQ